MNLLELPTLIALTAQDVPDFTTEEAAGFIGIFLAALAAVMIPFLIVLAVIILAQWKIYSKAGQPGWAALIPVYSTIVHLEVQRRPVWWIVFYLITPVPIAGGLSLLVMYIIMCLDLAKQFGKGGGFAAGLIFLFPIFLLILAFGGAQYQGAPAASAPPAPPADPPATPPADPPAAPPAEGA